MIKKISLLFVLLLSIQGQSQDIKRYTWDEKPQFATIPDQYKDQPAVVLFDKRWIHTRVGSYAFATFVMNHTAIKINKAEEINKYNKIKAENNGYIRDLRDFHARIIKPNGAIQVLSEDKIVETEIDKIKSIVFEGVEAGDILEYYFILKENPNAYGVEVYQREIPVLEAEFSTTKDGVYFETFSSDEFTKSTSYNKTTSKATNIPPYVEEKDARNIKNLVKIIYSISVPSMDMFSWSTFLPQYFKKPTFQYFKKNQARDFISNLNIDDALSTDEKVTKIDLYIKENFDFVWRGEKAKKITDLNDGKMKLTASDVFDLYAFTFKELKIQYKVVVGMSRFLGNISPSKYVAPLTHEFMYYIPETKKFVSPYEKYLSYGYPMYEIQGSEAITYSPESKSWVIDPTMTIPVTPFEYTSIQTKNTVTLSSDLSKATIDKIYSTTGYNSQLNRNYTKYLKENEEEKETIDYLKKTAFEGIDCKILEYSYDNKEFKYNYSNTPFVVNLKAETIESLAENTANLVLINLGKVIGQQDDLYQEEKRKFDVDLRYAKVYKHTIIFTIPEGYQVESYADLVIDKKMISDTITNCFFKSTARVEGNQLIVDVVEQYPAINYPVSLYQEYRKIINASADFTKATVVLKPKQ